MDIKVTSKDIDDAVDQLWVDIFELVDAWKADKSLHEIQDAKEHISMQIIEYGNLCWLRGEQACKEKENNQ